MTPTYKNPIEQELDNYIQDKFDELALQWRERNNMLYSQRDAAIRRFTNAEDRKLKKQLDDSLEQYYKDKEALTMKFKDVRKEKLECLCLMLTQK